jgi:hypothetical protein
LRSACVTASDGAPPVATKPPSGGFCSRRRVLSLAAAGAAGSMLGACGSMPAVPADAEWHDVPLPGKRRTQYRWEIQPEGRVLLAQANASASMFRKRLARPAEAPSEVEFAWWTQTLPEGGDVSDAESSDAAARVLFAFGGDHAKLSVRNQMMFEMAQSLTGEAPPFATLAYVWDATAPVGRLVVHPRTDRIRKIVVESGSEGLRQWRRYRRSLAADYRFAFGEAPGPLLAVAVMTDGDNTRSRLITRYRDIAWG